RQALRRARPARHRVTAPLPVGPLAVLAAVVGGIVLGEAAGPGAARMALVIGVVGVVAAGLLHPPHVRLVLAIVAFALLGTAVMQRALDGLARSPLTASVEQRADARVVATLVDDPDAARFDARALVRVGTRR